MTSLLQTLTGLKVPACNVLGARGGFFEGGRAGNSPAQPESPVPIRQMGKLRPHLGLLLKSHRPSQSEWAQNVASGLGPQTLLTPGLASPPTRQLVLPVEVPTRLPCQFYHLPSPFPTPSSWLFLLSALPPPGFVRSPQAQARLTALHKWPCGTPHVAGDSPKQEAGATS